MDLRNGKIIIETRRDATDILAAVDGPDGFILDVARRVDLQTRVPNELTPSETLGVVASLSTKVETGLGRSSSSRRAEARSAAETLGVIAGLGIRASAQLGSTTELVQELVQELRSPETPPAAG